MQLVPSDLRTVIDIEQLTSASQVARIEHAYSDPPPCTWLNLTTQTKSAYLLVKVLHRRQTRRTRRCATTEGASLKRPVGAISETGNRTHGVIRAGW